MWQLTGTQANLQTEQFAGKIDLLQPQLGLHALSVAGAESLKELSADLFRLRLPGGSAKEVIHECWVRGSDVVAVYARTPKRASQPEIYWRLLSSSPAVGLELIVSIHTDLLDDNPATGVESELPASEALWLSASASPEHAHGPGLVPGIVQLVATAPVCFSPNPLGLSPGSFGWSLQRNGSQRAQSPGASIVRLASQISYVEMAHPSDFCEAELSWHDGRITLKTPLFPELLEKGVIRRGRVRGWFVPSANDLQMAARLYREFAESDPPLTT